MKRKDISRIFSNQDSINSQESVSGPISTFVEYIKWRKIKYAFGYFVKTWPRIVIILIVILLFIADAPMCPSIISKTSGLQLPVSLRKHSEEYGSLIRKIILLKKYTADDERASLMLYNSFQFDEKLFSIYPNWDEDEEVFNDMLYDMKLLLLASLTYMTEKANKIFDILVFASHRIYDKCEEKLDLEQEVPWGINWYPFSVSYPKFLTYLIYVFQFEYGYYPEILVEKYIIYVNKIIPNPRESLGWSRSGANSIMMTVPYVGVALLDPDNYKSKMADENFISTLELLRVQYVEYGEGFYRDGGYIFHTNVRAYGYLYNSFLDIMLLAYFFNITSVMQVLINIYQLLNNPTVDFRSPCLFKRSAELDDLSGISIVIGKYGYEVISSISVLVVKTENFSMHVLGQKNGLAFYESDRTFKKFSQYWVMGRVYYYKNKMNDHILHDKFATRYPGIISIENESIIMDSSSLTTEAFVPELAESTVSKINAYEMPDEVAIAMYNHWKINIFNLEVHELLLITPEGYTVTYKSKYINDDEDIYHSNTVNLNNKIYVSVNLDECTTTEYIDELNAKRRKRDEYNEVDIILEQLIKDNTKIDFKKSTSYIHGQWNKNIYKNSNADEIRMTMTQMEHPSENTSVHSLQISPDANGYASFSFYHNSAPPPRPIKTRNMCICTPRFDLWLHEDHLFLHDRVRRRCSVSKLEKHTEPLYNGPIIELNLSTVNNQLGDNIVGLYPTMTMEYMSNKYIDVTGGKRKYTTFSNAKVDAQRILLSRAFDPTM